MMKAFVFSIAASAMILIACGDGGKNEKQANNRGDTVTKIETTTNTTTTQEASVDEAVTAYLQIKNALIADNGKEAAAAGKQLDKAMLNLDNASFTSDQKKVYDDVQEDMKEHAEHISTNAEKIAHQREHFDVLSKDMLDLVKVVKSNQILYRDHCPMYNDKKGADWLSEVKEIKNPYYGKKMLTCGEMKEEINR